MQLQQVQKFMHRFMLIAVIKEYLAMPFAIGPVG